LEKRVEQVLLGNEGGGGVKKRPGAGEEMAQTIYAHMNKEKNKSDLYI
jgi:hypothetical protein